MIEGTCTGGCGEVGISIGSGEFNPFNTLVKNLPRLKPAISKAVICITGFATVIPANHK